MRCLTAVGYTEEEAIKALNETSNDVNDALELLLKVSYFNVKYDSFKHDFQYATIIAAGITVILYRYIPLGAHWGIGTPNDFVPIGDSRIAILVRHGNKSKQHMKHSEICLRVLNY